MTARVTGFRRYWIFLIIWLAGPAVPISMSIAGLMVARSLSPSLYGRVAYFFSSFNLITILWHLGLGAQTTREVARSMSEGGIPAASRVVPPYLIARVLSVLILVPLVIGAAALGDFAIASAAVAGGIASLAAFVQALLQGLGRALLLATLQIGQALLYLAIVGTWGKDDPQRVFVTVISTYALSLLVTVWLSRPLFPKMSSWWQLSQGRWRSVGQSLGWLYAISLLQTPFSSLAVLTLGRAARFEDAAAFSIALTIPFLLAVSSTTVIAIQYYPNLCHLVADSDSDTRQEFDTFYRSLAWICVTAAAILLVHPQAVVGLLFTARYGGAVEPVASLASAAVLLPMGQLAVWTLIAHGLKGWALLGAATQLVAVVPFVVIALVIPEVPLWALGVCHAFAACAALAVWIVGLQRAATYDWRLRRVAVASLAAVVTAAATRLVNVDTGWAGFAVLILTGVAVGVVTGVIMWGAELGSSSTPLRHALAKRASSSGEHSTARSARL